MEKIGTVIRGNPYVGRGIVVGLCESGKKAAVAYFIMGRSANSRNRVLVTRNGEVRTEPFDASKVEDPSLIIYTALKKCGDNLVVTNGDQTETVCDGMNRGKTFFAALSERKFEPDKPNFTPRISAILYLNGEFRYEMSILKAADENGEKCERFGFSYEPVAGMGHFIHTYRTDGNPLPSFSGEPEKVAVPDDIALFGDDLWKNLDENNKIALYVRYIDLASGCVEEKLYNKNK